MPAIYHEGSWLGNATDPEVLVKDTVGWTGKNLLKNTATTQTQTGVTFTVNADKSVTVNGTGTNPNAGVRELNQHFTLPAGNYILSGSPHNVYSETGFRLQIYNWTDREVVVYCDTDEDVPFTIGENKDIAVRIWYRVTPSTGGSNITFYPMIRRADITDPTYEPYHESVQNQLNAQGVLGAKNLWKYPYDITAQTLNGMTLTVDSDGVVTLNGTTTSLSEFLLLGTTSTMLKVADMPSKNLILKGSRSANYCNEVVYRDSNNAYISDQRAFNDDMELVIPSNTYYMRMAVLVEPNVTLANAVLYPMLRLASDPDDTYQPYAMTNRELTPQIVYNQNNICVCKQGKIVIAQFNGAKPSDIAALNFANMGAKPAFYVNTFQCRCDAKPTTIEINANGTVVNVGYYASYGATYTDLKSDSSKSVNGSICFIAE